MPTHVLYGDSFLVSAELKKLEQEAGGNTLLEANQHRLNGSQTKLPELLAVCNAMPFMDTCRLVIVTGLLTTLENRSNRSGSRGRTARSASSNPSLGEWGALAPAVPAMPDTTRLFLVDHVLSDSNPLLRALQPVAQVQNLTAPTGEALARYVRDLAQQKGSGISPAAIKTLTDLVSNDLWTLDRELEKLSLYAAGRNIQEADIQELVSQVREASIFNAVDALVDGRPGLAFRLLQQLRQDGASLPYIIGMIERQLRLVALARYWSEQRLAPQELAGKLSVPPFAARKAVEQARRNPWANINRHYQRLLNTDLAIKTGQLESEDLALELLVADLAEPSPNPGRSQVRR